MKKKEINGRKIKKLLPFAESCRQTYHNKHVSGSGNFGFVLTDTNDKWWRFDGAYNNSKTLYRLSFGEYSNIGVPIETEGKTVEEVLEKAESIRSAILDFKEREEEWLSAR
jgi:hypothetical protein